MTVTCNYRSTAVIILPGVYLPPQRNATVADDAFSLLFISIHAPREGSDRGALSSRERVENFNPRSPRGERLSPRRTPLIGSVISIHAPREGSDAVQAPSAHIQQDFNPRSPRGERHYSYHVDTPTFFISIHAPREGSDCLISPGVLGRQPFQSTLPARGATR